jgi:hypothetical protein
VKLKVSVTFGDRNTNGDSIFDGTQGTEEHAAIHINTSQDYVSNMQDIEAMSNMQDI